MHNKKQTNKQSQKKMSSRCSKCRELGHNTRLCYRNTWEAVEMKIAYARVAKLAFEANKQRALLVAQGDASQEGIITQVIDVRDRDGGVMFMTRDAGPVPVVPVVPVAPVVANIVQPVSNTTKQVPKSLVKIQEILFDNSQDLPDGLYKQLMDALIIKG